MAITIISIKDTTIQLIFTTILPTSDRTTTILELRLDHTFQFRVLDKFHQLTGWHNCDNLYKQMFCVTCCLSILSYRCGFRYCCTRSKFMLNKCYMEAVIEVFKPIYLHIFEVFLNQKYTKIRLRNQQFGISKVANNLI